MPIKDFIHHYLRALFNDIPRVGAYFYDIPGSNGNKNFPIVLREHFDSYIHIEEKVIPMEYPEITQAELHKHLNNIKKNKATGPDDVKGELYRSLGRSEMCVGKLQTTVQNIIDNDLKIKSWEKSYTRLIPMLSR